MEYSGSEYEGTYDAGRFSGNGTYTYPDGESRARARSDDAAFETSARGARARDAHRDQVRGPVPERDVPRQGHAHLL